MQTIRSLSCQDRLQNIEIIFGKVLVGNNFMHCKKYCLIVFIFSFYHYFWSIFRIYHKHLLIWSIKLLVLHGKRSKYFISSHSKIWPVQFSKSIMKLPTKSTVWFFFAPVSAIRFNVIQKVSECPWGAQMKITPRLAAWKRQQLQFLDKMYEGNGECERSCR